MARQVGHYIRDERLQVEDNILLFKKIVVSRHAKHRIKDERLQVEDNIEKTCKSTLYIPQPRRGEEPGRAAVQRQFASEYYVCLNQG